MHLTVDEPEAGRFYLPPKIYKAESPGRPIGSVNGHPTEKRSEFVDFHLQSHVLLVGYNIFPEKKKQCAMGPLPPETLIVSMNVTHL